MSFLDDFNNCMRSSGLPTPGQVFDSLADAAEFLDRLHTEWEMAGGDTEMTLGALVAALGLGAASGIDEAVLEVLGTAAEVTVIAYLHACSVCLANVAGSSIWSLIASTQDSWLHDQLLEQAEEQNIPNPTANA